VVTLERITAIDPKAADVIATLRASIDGMHAAHNSPPAQPGLRGLLVGRLNTALGLTAKDDSQPRHVFLEAALGIEGGSSKTLSMAQCNATIWWLDQGGAQWTQHIVQAALMAAGQTVLPDPLVEEALRMGAEIRPTQDNRKRSKVMWIDEAGAERKFWGYVTDTLGLTPNDVFEALGVDSLRASTQTKEQIVEALKARVETKQEELRAGLEPKEALHGEAKAISWMDTFAPGGEMVNLTARQGATPDDIVANALALEAAWAKLQKLGWTAVPRVPRRVVNGKQEHKGNGKAPVQSTTPPPPTTPAPGPPQAPQAGNAPQAPQAKAPAPAPAAGGNGNGGVEQITEVRVTAPAGKPQVEFWRASRKYPELKWALGGEALLKLAPALAAAGWTPAHFDTIGGNFTVKWAVGWEISPKNPKWKDITEVKVMG